MLLSIGIPGWISGYLRLYAAALVLAALVASALFIRRLPGRLRSVLARGWPIAAGTIESVKVKTVSGQALGELAYSYLVNGERYSGYLLLQFADEQDAWETIDPLKGQQIFLRYRSTLPAVSAVRWADQTPLLFPFRRQESFLKRLVSRQVLEAFVWNPGSWALLEARNWPLTKARVEHSPIGERGDAEDLLLLLSYVAEVSYSYSVGGEYYSGRIERCFCQERSAMEFVNNLKETGLMVRYNPTSPSMSVVRGKDQVVFQAPKYHPIAGA